MKGGIYCIPDLTVNALNAEPDNTAVWFTKIFIHHRMVETYKMFL